MNLKMRGLVYLLYLLVYQGALNTENITYLEKLYFIIIRSHHLVAAVFIHIIFSRNGDTF